MCDADIAGEVERVRCPHKRIDVTDHASVIQPSLKNGDDARAGTTVKALLTAKHFNE
jgi:hypothetical protein